MTTSDTSGDAGWGGANEPRGRQLNYTLVLSALLLVAVAGQGPIRRVLSEPVMQS